MKDNKKTSEKNIFTIDIHTHIMPEHMPRFADKFGYGGFVHLEHHQACRARMIKDGEFFREIVSNCWDPDQRVKDCDVHDVDVQVLSTIPILFSYWANPLDALEVSKFLNDHIAGVVNLFPKRFLGLGTIPLQDTDIAIKELERCVNDLGLAGVEIGSHVNDMNLSDAKLFPFFEAVQDLNTAIFCHPWEMMGHDKMRKYWLPWLVGMPAETSRAICSMIFGGVFERLPGLRVAFAHGGGSFPATIGRIEKGFNARPDLCAMDNNVNPRHYLGKFYVDSLTHDREALKYLINLLGQNRVALGSDYPFPLGEQVPGQLIHSLDLDDRSKEMLLSGSALSWLGMEKKQFQE